MPTPLKYFHTVRNLTARQVIGQLRNRIQPRLTNTTAFFNQPSPAFPGCRWNPSVKFIPPGGQGAMQPNATLGEFTFINRTERIDWPPRWHCPELPRLWQFNLHYFDWLWHMDDSQAVAATNDWIEKYPLARNHAGWEPYPTSLRLMNWTANFFGSHRTQTYNDSKFRNRLWRSIYLQAEWLSRNIEYHLLANHLFENAAVLTFVGSSFSGPAAARRKRTGLTILRNELDEQILTDGMHFELSPMYHSRVLYLLHLLAGTADPDLRKLVHNPIRRMSRALAMLSHPDGRIALLNDSAFGIYNEPHQLLNGYFQTFSGPFALPEAGYYGWRGAEGNYIVCDAGPIGPDYQPGHSHADIFSFELSLFGHRVIVDSGVSNYEPGRDRDYSRSTRAHNTVEVSGQDQCEMWGSHRVARRARVSVIDWRSSPRGFTLEAIHDGYRLVKAGLRHKRRFTWDASGRLQVTDSLEGPQVDGVISRLHLHPDCRIYKIEGNKITLSNGCIECPDEGKITIEESQYFPEFGKSIRNKQICFHPIQGLTKFSFIISQRNSA